VSVLSALNQWILENQALVISLGIPLFTIMVGFLGSYLSHKSKTDEVRLAGRTKLADFRIDNFNKLNDEIARLQRAVSKSVVEGVLTQETPDQEQLEELLLIAEKISVRVHADPKHRDQFMHAFDHCVERLYKQEESDENAVRLLRESCYKIVSSEWSQIERELKHLA
jgi:hypothetical protein